VHRLVLGNNKKPLVGNWAVVESFCGALFRTCAHNWNVAISSVVDWLLILFVVPNKHGIIGVRCDVRSFVVVVTYVM
jgi:hypothetical protein